MTGLIVESLMAGYCGSTNLAPSIGPTIAVDAGLLCLDVNDHGVFAAEDPFDDVRDLILGDVVDSLEPLGPELRCSTRWASPALPDGSALAPMR